MNNDRVVLKFGGTSVGNSENMAKAIEKVLKAREEYKEVTVVLSAVAGVTNLLLYAGRSALYKKPKDTLLKLKEKHYEACDVIPDTKLKMQTIIDIDEKLAELEKILTGIFYVGEVTPRSLDYIVSFGERLSTLIVARALKARNIKCEQIDSSEIVVTDDNFQNAVVDFELTRERARQKLDPLLSQGYIPIITGFLGASTSGQRTTLGRGGSDYSAAIFGDVLDAREVWIMTDVDGVMSVDPNIVPDAYLIPVLTYDEAMELSYFGAKVIHPKTLEAAKIKKIPTYIKNTFSDSKGTLVTAKRPEDESVVKSISILKDASIVEIRGSGLGRAAQVMKEIFHAMEEGQINVMMVSQGSSQSNVSFVVKNEDVKQVKKVLLREYYERFNIIGGVNVVSIVGQGMSQKAGMAARFFDAVASLGVNNLMISQGSSEVSINVAILESEMEKAVKAIHDEFLSEKKE
ncbi:MAG TPA: aspartate kinase [Candidatus Methanofastidiosa archaeon]|nr:aspartate kinase [Candidatus Methanofastidiosa archaeon]